MSRKGLWLPIVSRLMLAAGFLFTIVDAGVAADPNEPNDSPASPTDIVYGYESADAEISPEGDVDFYRFSGAAGDVVEIRTRNSLAAELDGRLWLIDAEGVVLADNDDDEDFKSSRLTVILPESAVYLIRYAFRSNQPVPSDGGSGSSTEVIDPSSQPVPARVSRESAVPQPAGTETTGPYVLTMLKLDPPPANRLIVGTGFAGVVPLAWSQPDVTALSGNQIVIGVERSTNGGASFDLLRTVVEPRFLDAIGSSGEELQYRIRTDYPDGAGSSFSEIVSATPSAAGYRLSSRYVQSPPVINGSIDAGEWSQAVQIPLIDEVSGAEVTTLYLMNDDDYFYLATDRPARVAEIGIYFDSDDDDSYSQAGTEGNYWIVQDRTVIFRPIRGVYPDHEFGEFENGPPGVMAATSVSAFRSQYEVRFDLKASHLRGQPGDVVGIYVFDLANTEFAGYPPGPGDILFIAPRTFSDLTLGGPQPEIFLPSTELAFLDTAVGQDSTKLITIQNRGVAPLDISGLQIGGDDAESFEVRTTLPIVINPGNSGQVSVAFAPLEHGEFDATLQIQSNDPAGVSEVGLTGISVNQPPFVQVRNPVARAIGGQTLSIEAQCADDLLLASVTCEYITGSGSMGQTVLVQEAGEIYRGSIPGNVIGAQGLHYRILVSDGEAATSVTSYFDVVVETTRLESPALPGGNAQTAYRLVSIPSLLDDDGAGVFTGSLGEYDPKAWRLFGLEGGEYVEQTNRQRIAPGEALWLITRDAAALSTGPGESVPQSEPFRVPLQPGWTLVGDPFAYSISAERLSLVSSGTLDVRRYDESWSISTSGLVPWEGYAVFSEIEDTLLIRPNAPEGFGAAAMTASPAGIAGLTAIALNDEVSRARRPDAAQWWVGIEARCQSARDADNMLGVHPSASLGRDSYDLAEPPPIGEYVSLYFPRPDWPSVASRFCTDIREAAANHAFSFAVESNIDDRIRLSFDLSAFPEGPLVWVMDDATGVVWDLREQATIEIGPALSGPRELSLFVGDAAGVGSLLGAAQSTVVLSGGNVAFPNPSRSAVTLFYELPESQPISVAIFGVTGNLVREVRSREAQSQGRHAIVWDGRDSAGAPVARGSYFYRISGDSFAASGRLILID